MVSFMAVISQWMKQTNVRILFSLLHSYFIEIVQKTKVIILDVLQRIENYKFVKTETDYWQLLIISYHFASHWISWYFFSIFVCKGGVECSLVYFILPVALTSRTFSKYILLVLSMIVWSPSIVLHYLIFYNNECPCS